MRRVMFLSIGTHAKGDVFPNLGTYVKTCFFQTLVCKCQTAGRQILYHIVIGTSSESKRRERIILLRIREMSALNLCAQIGYRYLLCCALVSPNSTITNSPARKMFELLYSLP
jgi:hypothetical protein